MSKPDDIPQDILDAAYNIFVSEGDGLVALARAIATERERCVKAANAWQMTRGTNTEKAAFATHKRLVIDAILSGRAP